MQVARRSPPTAPVLTPLRAMCVLVWLLVVLVQIVRVLVLVLVVRVLVLALVLDPVVQVLRLQLQAPSPLGKHSPL